MNTLSPRNVHTRPPRCSDQTVFWHLLVLLLAIGIVDPVRAQSADDPEPARPVHRTVMPGFDIHVSETNRTHRLGTLLEGAGVLSSWWTDGYSLRLADGPSGALGPSPVIEIDGIPLTIESFGRVHLAALPVSAFDIQSISWTPGIRSSGYRSAGGHPGAPGILSISTVAPEGTTLRGSVVLVNETGDPGPDRYRSGGRNVDRSGPHASLRASVREGRWFAEAALDADEHHMTDERIVRRIYRVYDAGEQPVVRVFHPHGRLRFDAETVLVDVRAGRMTADDFLYLDEIAQEWPHRQTVSYVAGRADWAIDDSWSVGLTTALRRSEIESRELSVTGPPSLLLRSGTARAALVREFDSGSTAIAAGIRSEDVDRAGSFGASFGESFGRQVDTRTFGEIGYDRRMSSSTFISVDLSLAHPVDTRADPGSSSSIASISLLQHVRGLSIAAGTSVASHDRPSISSMSGLVAAGLEVGELGTSPVDRGLRTRERRMEVFVRVRPVDSQRDVLPWLNMRLRRSQGLSVPELSFSQLEDKIRFTSEPVYRAGAHGLTWQASAGLDWWSGGSRVRSGPSPASFRLRMVARIRGVLSGTEPFRTAASGLPTYDLVTTLRWSRSARFGAELSARIDGPRTWRIFEETPFAERPVQTRLDGALWKRIAGDSTLLTLGLRNLLDTSWRIHPAGIDEQLAVRAGMSITFNRSTP